MSESETTPKGVLAPKYPAPPMPKPVRDPRLDALKDFVCEERESPALDSGPHPCEDSSREREFFIKYSRVGLFSKRDRWTVCRRISDAERRKFQTDKIFFELEHFNDFKDADRVRNNCLREW